MTTQQNCYSVPGFVYSAMKRGTQLSFVYVERFYISWFNTSRDVINERFVKALLSEVNKVQNKRNKKW